VSARRGQTLVLACLSVMLLALMVLVTLSIAWHVRDRIELQVTADAAAYSEAVEVARTFNQAALMNRAQLAMEVSALGMSSLMAWSSHHYANTVALQQAEEELLGEYSAACGPFCPCCCMQIPLVMVSMNATSQELQRLKGVWDGDEKAAAQQMNTQWKGAQMMKAEEDAMLKKLLDVRLKNQQLAGVIATKANDRELSVVPNGDDKSLTETKAALYPDDPIIEHQPAQASMGTRGYHFTTMGQGGRQPMETKLEQSAKAGNGAAIVEPAFQEYEFGTGYGQQRHAQTVKTVDPGYDVWAEAHGGELVLVWPCGCTMASASGVQDTQLASGNDGTVRHTFTPGDNEPASSRHHLDDSNGRVFPDLLTYNFPEIEDPNNDFGQPKLYSLIQRQHRPKPWDLDFTFHFSQSGGGADYKPDPFKQVAVGSSIVYYHRPDAWAEPPNLFNPFWRATLYAADDDVAKELQKAGLSDQSTAVQGLLDNGLKVVTR
jgi:hypothetical protein